MDVSQPQPQARSASDNLPEYVRALFDPATVGHPADDPRLHETHISWVVLAGPYAYKVKKPVNFGFLDFSTVQRRRAGCDDEVRLNRRFSPDIYLGVRTIVRSNGGYRFGETEGDGEPVVWMRRLPESGMLPNLLAAGAVDRRLVRRIARDLVRFHARAAHGAGIDQYGSIETIRGNWEENFTQMAPFAGNVIPVAIDEQIQAYVGRFIDQQAALLHRRVAEGRIREGHGDLHAASICVVEGRPRLFDCLEFNARFRCADVAAEVAFLAMDLAHFGRTDLADDFVSAYVWSSGDGQILELLCFYQCYRAYVRGKIRCLRLSAPALAVTDRERVTAEARAYFDLAWTYAGGLRSPLIVATMGLPASGKSSLARSLAGRLGLVHLSSDLIRKQRAGLPPTGRGDQAFNTGVYAPEMTRQTYASMRRKAGVWLRRGRSVVLDATYGQASERAMLRRLAERTGARLVLLHCRTDEATIRRRLLARSVDPAVVSDARIEHLPELRAAFQEPSADERAIAIDTSAPLEAAALQAVTILRG